MFRPISFSIDGDDDDDAPPPPQPWNYTAKSIGTTPFCALFSPHMFRCIPNPMG